MQEKKCVLQHKILKKEFVELCLEALVILPPHTIYLSFVGTNEHIVYYIGFLLNYNYETVCLARCTYETLINELERKMNFCKMCHFSCRRAICKKKGKKCMVQLCLKHSVKILKGFWLFRFFNRIKKERTKDKL